MSVVSVRARDFILALFIRDDGQRFLLGDNGYDFKDSQLHFSANTIENDEVVKQGADGVMLAGQVRRASVQSFDGFVGDATMPKETIEQMRRDFFAFFAKGHHFRVVYVDTARNAWQRKGGYLVDAPEVKELYQIHPEYHVGLNFEDVSYYSYNENSDGDEILANTLAVPVSTDVNGGLEWDEDGAVSEPAVIEYDTETAEASGKSISISDAADAPLASFRLDGETSQNGTPTPDAPVAVNTTTGENVVKICGKNLYDEQLRVGDISNPSANPTIRLCSTQNLYLYPGTYTFSSNIASPIRYAIGVNSVSAPPTGTYPTYIYDSGWVVGNGVRTTTFTIDQGGYLSVQLSKVNNAELTVSEAQAYHYQLELGSTATTYEPYQGQSYEVNLGKNLFDINGNFQQGYINNSGVIASDDYNVSQVDYIPVVSSTAYTLSYEVLETGTAIQGVAFYNQDKTFISRTTGPNISTFATPTDTAYIRVYFRNPNGMTVAQFPNYVTNIQIELGPTATPYAAYFAPIELCKIGNYQDYIYKSGGKWYVHKEVGKVILDGSESWSLQNSCFTISFINCIATGDYSWNNKVLVASDYYQAQGTSYRGNVQDGKVAKAIDSGSVHQIAFKNTSITSVDGWKTWLGSNNTTLYYVLATPTDTEITNEALIAQLDALLNNARTYAGVNNIFTVTPNEQGTLEIGYYTRYDIKITAGGYVWEVGGEGGPTTVLNNSIDNVAPIWTVKGPTLNPTLENATTGEQIEYVGMIAEGQTLVIDMGEQTALLDGLNVISNVVGDYISLAPGANTLLYSVTGTADASEIGWSEIVG